MISSKKHKAKLKGLSDQDLIGAILGNTDREQLRWLQEELYTRYANKVYLRCKYLLKSTEEAKDLAHDILVKVFTKLKSFRAESSFYSWVFAITYNQCMNHLEQKKKMRLEDFDQHSFEIATDEIELEHKVLLEVKLSQLEQLLEQIGVDEKMILLMRYKDEMSVKQIAKNLSLGESAVKMRLKRSRDHLAQLINAQ